MSLAGWPIWLPIPVGKGMIIVMHPPPWHPVVSHGTKEDALCTVAVSCVAGALPEPGTDGRRQRLGARGKQALSDAHNATRVLTAAVARNSVTA